MKNIFFIFLSSILIISCYRYEQPALVSLSGEYIIDKITVDLPKGTNVNIDTVYLPGDVFINESDSFPLNNINVGFTKWHFDYSVISFNPTIGPSGQLEWSKQYFYNLVPSYTPYEFGYVDINMINRKLILKIIDDTAESVTFRTTRNWVFLNVWEESSITIHLTRVGP